MDITQDDYIARPTFGPSYVNASQIKLQQIVKSQVQKIMLQHKVKPKKKQPKFHESELQTIDIMNNYQISAMQDYEIEKQKPLPDVDSDDPDYQEKLQQKYEEDDLKQTQDMR